MTPQSIYRLVTDRIKHHSISPIHSVHLADIMIVALAVAVWNKSVSLHTSGQLVVSSNLNEAWCHSWAMFQLSSSHAVCAESFLHVPWPLCRGSKQVGLASLDKCECGMAQTIPHIVKECRLTMLSDGGQQSFVLPMMMQLTGWNERRWKHLTKWNEFEYMLHIAVGQAVRCCPWQVTSSIWKMRQMDRRMNGCFTLCLLLPALWVLSSVLN